MNFKKKKTIIEPEKENELETPSNEKEYIDAVSVLIDGLMADGIVYLKGIVTEPGPQLRKCAEKGKLAKVIKVKPE